MRTVTLALALLFPAAALAETHCVPATPFKTALTKKHDKWTDLTPSQWQFLRGVYAVNPATPPGLPSGDAAAMVQFAGIDGAMVFFIDAGQMCEAMPIPTALVLIVNDVGSHKIGHVGSPM
jgi:hypothetical protein